MESATREAAEKAMEAFRREYEAKYPKPVECLLKDAESLLAFFDYPAEHWRHIRTTNAIESVFATVRLRTRVTKGAGSRKAGLMMAYKLMQAASGRWRALHGAHLVRYVLDGETFKDGILQTSEAARDAA